MTLLHWSLGGNVKIRTWEYGTVKMHVSFCLFTELTLGLRATPFKMSSSGLSSGSSIKVRSTLCSKQFLEEKFSQCSHSLKIFDLGYFVALQSVHLQSRLTHSSSPYFFFFSYLSCILVTAITYKGIESKWGGTVRDRVWGTGEREQGRTMFIKHGVGSRSHLSL